MTFQYQAIGVIHSPFQAVAGMPVQPAGAEQVLGTVEVFDPFVPGLQDLGGFSHILLLYHFHRSTGFALRVTPFLDRVPRGLFATRAPRRPNAIGLSVVRLLEVAGGTLRVRGLDVVDGTPLLDIKPYVPQFDHHPVQRTGWLGAAADAVATVRSDGRFG